MKNKDPLWIVLSVVAIISFIIYACYDEIWDRILYWNVDIPSITKAAEAGDVEAQSTLGYYYLAGKGVKKDIAKGIEWTRKAAEQGDMLSQYTLGRHYLSGNGVPKDKVEAVKWLSKSADQGYPLAQEWLKKAEEE